LFFVPLQWPLEYEGTRGLPEREFMEEMNSCLVDVSPPVPLIVMSAFNPGGIKSCLILFCKWGVGAYQLKVPCEPKPFDFCEREK